MPFEIRYKTAAGAFHIQLERDVSAQEAMQLAQIGSNVLGMGFNVSESKQSSDPGSIFSQKLIYSGTFKTVPTNDSSGSAIISSTRVKQTKLAEFPVKAIGLGYYKEPTSGVRIEMVAMAEGPERIKAIKLLMAKTGMPMLACKDIVFGNHKCPILTIDIANKVMTEFKTLGVYAVLEDARRGASALDSRKPGDYHSVKTDGAPTQ